MASQVLNIGHAKLVGKLRVGALTSLGALILNDNALTTVSGGGPHIITADIPCFSALPWR